jgi:hypothetical protein
MYEEMVKKSRIHMKEKSFHKMKYKWVKNPEFI